MKCLAFAFGLLMIISSIGFAQSTQSPTPQPARRNVDTRTSSSTAADTDAGFDALRSLDIPQTSLQSGNLMSEQIQSLYRKPNKKSLVNLLPSDTLLAKYEIFLQQPNTGIFKLNADSTCATNANVVVATEKCLANSIPGAGTAYSFRVNSYRILHLADLILDKNVIKTDGIMQQGLLVKLGDIELDQVSLETTGLKFLLAFKPATNQEEFAKNDGQISTGIEKDGFNYRLGFFADDKTTFALRSIAYRGKVARSINGVNFNELDFDKRKDIVVVFRIVEKDANGDVTLLWKKLADKDSPKLKLEKNE